MVVHGTDGGAFISAIVCCELRRLIKLCNTICNYRYLWILCSPFLLSPAISRRFFVVVDFPHTHTHKRRKKREFDWIRVERRCECISSHYQFIHLRHHHIICNYFFPPFSELIHIFFFLENHSDALRPMFYQMWSMVVVVVFVVAKLRIFEAPTANSYRQLATKWIIKNI